MVTALNRFITSAQPLLIGTLNACTPEPLRVNIFDVRETLAQRKYFHIGALYLHIERFHTPYRRISGARGSVQTAGQTDGVHGGVF